MMLDGYTIFFLQFNVHNSTLHHCPWQGHICTSDCPLNLSPGKWGSRWGIFTSQHQTQNLAQAEGSALLPECINISDKGMEGQQRKTVETRTRSSDFQTFPLTSWNKLGCGILKFQLCQCKRLSPGGHRQEPS